MTLQTLSFLFGALLLLAAIIGGGFEVKELKLPKMSGGGRIVAAIAGVAFIGLALKSSTADGSRRASAMSEMEWDKDRFGADYNYFPLPHDNPKECEDACASDEQCKAWTYVKPNTIRGPDPMCYLKRARPPLQDNKNCVSGTKKSE